MDISSSVNNESGVKMTEDPAIPLCLNDYCVSNEEYLGMIEVYIYPTTFEWVLIALYIVIFIIGLGGNFLVCFAVLGNKQMRTISNLFLLNLSGCDFLVTLICLPTTVLSDVTDTWYMGNAFCKFVQYLQGVSVSVSVFTLSIISIERWFFICHPSMFKWTVTRAWVMIVFIWVIAMLMLIPDLVAIEVKQLFPELTILLTSCEANWVYRSLANYEFFKMFILYIGPCCFMGSIYTHIVWRLWSKTTSAKGLSTVKEISGTSFESQLTSLRKEAKMMIADILMFALCYLPVHLLAILRHTNSVTHAEWIPYLVKVTNLMCYLNSAIDPVIYYCLSVSFRDEFRKACCCCCRSVCASREWVQARRESHNENIQATEQMTLTATDPTKDHVDPKTHNGQLSMTFTTIEPS